MERLAGNNQGCARPALTRVGSHREGRQRRQTRTTLPATSGAGTYKTDFWPRLIERRLPTRVFTEPSESYREISKR